jgi:hypothetical protein
MGITVRDHAARQQCNCWRNYQAKVAALRGVQFQTQEELDALLPSVLDRAFKGEL